MTKFYIAYGSNMNFSQMRYRCPNAKFVETKVLKDVRVVFRRNGGGYANLEKAKGYKTPVVIYEITDKCEKALDRYEGFPTYYVKKNVTLNIGGDKKNKVQALIYVMSRKFENEVFMPRRDYFETIRMGYEKHDISLDSLYLSLKETLNEFYYLEEEVE